MSENPNLLRSEIKGSTSTVPLTGEGSTAFPSRISSLASDYPTGEAQNFHMFTKIIQELNRKLDENNLNSHIVQPTDAGFRPLNFDDFFGAGSPSVGVPDYLELEDGNFLLQENGSKLVLEQDV